MQTYSYRSLKHETPGLGIRSSVFWVNSSFLAKKWATERFAREKKTICLFSHFWWVTWAICSWSVVFVEQPERIAHSRSFVLSDLSEVLTVAQLIWAKWANERWANEQIPSPANNKYKFKPKISQNYDETLPFLVQYYIKHFKAFKTSCICL